MADIIPLAKVRHYMNAFDVTPKEAAEDILKATERAAEMRELDCEIDKFLDRRHPASLVDQLFPFIPPAQGPRADEGQVFRGFNYSQELDGADE